MSLFVLLLLLVVVVFLVKRPSAQDGIVMDMDLETETVFASFAQAHQEDQQQREQKDISQLLEQAKEYERTLEITQAKTIYNTLVSAYPHNTFATRTALNSLAELDLFALDPLQQPFANLSHARALLSQAQALGSPHAQHNLAFLHALGIGVPQDTARSILLDYFASIGGSLEASLSLGHRHRHGHGVPRSCQTAVQYYRKVSEAVMSMQENGGELPVLDKHSLLHAPGEGAESDKDVVQFYRHSAQAGDTAAQSVLGHIHYYGARGVERDVDQARRLYLQAGAQGDASALSHLGTIYLDGLGEAEQNNETALYYFTKAAELGSASAYNGLGFMYLNGFGVEQDLQQALKMYKRAADAGNAEAQFALGTMYFSGKGVDVSLPTALHYFGQAGQHGHVRALYNLGQMYLNGLGTQQSCEMGLDLHKSVAERGVWAVTLGRARQAYLRGEYETAVMYYGRAAHEGMKVAQVNAAFMFDRGLGVHALSLLALDKSVLSCKDIAFTLWKYAAAQGDVDAQRILGDYHYYGYTREQQQQDYARAAEYYRASADKKDAQANFNLGYMYQHGLGVECDFFLARRFYDLAASYDAEALVPSRLALGWMYVQVWVQLVLGSVLGLDQTLANQLLRVAADMQTESVEQESHSLWDKIPSIGIDLEDFALLVLTFMLGVVIFARHYHRA